ncbi:hypothetical protein DPEC_G00073690 [Dallia pectoralis]|uniref:Uncharacterized protein n=1 Tax=Dallia pectoralis TaxID=75939 RepID=A0ACC2H344_DALPE|nr:hypothetical protein DPEC_G00073690 [Dallia pectoralis]
MSPTAQNLSYTSGCRPDPKLPGCCTLMFGARPESTVPCNQQARRDTDKETGTSGAILAGVGRRAGLWMWGRRAHSSFCRSSEEARFSFDLQLELSV